MRDNVLWRKQARIIMALASALEIDEEKALDIFYSTETCKQLSDAKYGLQLMSDGYVLENVLGELNEKSGIGGLVWVEEVANCVVDGVEEISQINEVIAIGDKEQMWDLLQDKVSKYKHLISLLSPFTKTRLITVSKEDLTIADLRNQLEIISRFALLHEGLNCGCKIMFKDEVYKIVEKLI